jgi:hypothetical protein
VARRGRSGDPGERRRVCVRAAIGIHGNFLYWTASIKSEGVVRSATEDGKIPFIHSDDIADVAVACMKDP